MGDFFKMLVMVVGGAVVLTIFALIYFAAAFTVLGAMAGSVEPASLGEKVGAVVPITGLCAGLLIAMSVAGEKLKADRGQAPMVVLIIGWGLVLAVSAVFVFGTFGAAFDAVLQHKTLGIFAVILYAAIVGWAVRKITQSRA